MGDLVIVYEGFNKQKAVTLTKGQSRTGTGASSTASGGQALRRQGVRQGRRPGLRLAARAHPELWTKVLPHRAQIFAAGHLSSSRAWSKPGSVVLESGTGASLTHALARSRAEGTCTFSSTRAGGDADLGTAWRSSAV